MPTPDNSDLVSKCVAMQYGVFIAGIVLLIVVVFNYYSDYSNQCVMVRKSPEPSCQPKVASGVSQFAAKPSGKLPVGHHKSTGKLNEKQLEGFLNYSHDQQDFDFASYGQDPEASEYDPAKESLEQSVFDSHKEFVDDSYTSTQGPNSSNIERDDDTGPVKRWGMRRVDYSSVVSGDDARTVSSEYADQVASGPSSFVL